MKKSAKIYIFFLKKSIIEFYSFIIVLFDDLNPFSECIQRNYYISAITAISNDVSAFK